MNKCRVCKGELSHIKYIRGEETGNETALLKCNNCDSYFSKVEFLKQTTTDVSNGSIDVYMNKDYVLKRVEDILSYSLKNHWVPDKNSDFLDIGCGVGWSLLEAEKKGFNAYGIEPMVDAVEYAKNILNVNVINSLFKSELFSEKKFDLIMMDQVLEHVPNPTETLIDAFSLLKPGGLFFLSVPPIDWSRIMLSMSYQCPMKIVNLVEHTKAFNKFTLLAKKYDIFQFPEGHINYFSTRSISILAERCNAQLLEQYHIQNKRAKYFPFAKLSTGSFFLRKN